MKPIIKIDASSLRNSGCFKRLYYTVVDGYRPKKGFGISAHWGTSFHKFCETYVRTKGEFLPSMLEAQKTFRSKIDEIAVDKAHAHLTLEYLTITCQAYADKMQKDEHVIEWKDTTPLVELKFAIPFLATDHAEFLLCGTIDKIGKFKNGCYAVGDYKTTASWNQEEYFEQYRLDPQLLTYVWVLKWFAKEYPDSIYGTIDSLPRIGAFIDGVFCGKAKHTPDFVRSPVMFFTPEQLMEYEMLLRSMCIGISQHIASGTLPTRSGMVNGSCKTTYGKCPFFYVCGAPDSTAAEHVLQHQFNQKPYDPLNFN